MATSARESMDNSMYMNDDKSRGGLNGTSALGSSTSGGVKDGLGSSINGGPKGTTAPATANGTNDLWESILSSVGSNKAVAGRTVIVLGDSGSGKSTMISKIAAESSKSGAQQTTNNVPENSLDLALNFDSIDIHDSADEETVARLSVYSLSSPNPPYSSLFKLAFSNPLESLIILVLDWSKPWTFLRSLKGWIELIQSGWKGRPEWECQEGKDMCEAFVRASFEQLSTTTTATSVEDDTPLSEGLLDVNIGIPLIIVCTKADEIAMLEREQDFKEEQVDYIQQSLRTLCMRYGAALFSVSRAQPASFEKLQSYLLHRLFTTSSIHSNTNSQQQQQQQQSQQQEEPESSQQPTQHKNNISNRSTFNFTHRANVVDRDDIVVPAGWDSWSKIKILRDGFDCNALCRAWDKSVDLTPDGSAYDDDLDSDGKKLDVLADYEAIIPDVEADDQQINLSKNTTIENEDEQSFLSRHYDMLQKDQVKDPRAQFQQRPITSEMSGVVGPMGSASLNLPSVEKALDVDSEDTVSRPRMANRKDTYEAPSGSRSPVTSSQSTMPSTPKQSSAPRPSTPNQVSSPDKGASNVSNEALANFFQSLLSRPRDGSGSRQNLSSLSSSKPAGDSADNSRSAS